MSNNSPRGSPGAGAAICSASIDWASWNWTAKGAELRLQVPTERWLCAAIVDRLILNSEIIETGATSYRFEHSRAPRTG